MQFKSPESQYEIVGYYVDYVDTTTYKCYGMKEVPEEYANGREYGESGRKVIVFDKDFYVDKIGKQKCIKVSKGKTITVWETLYPICGHAKVSTIGTYYKT
jgi:hypothetical protein